MVCLMCPIVGLYMIHINEASQSFLAVVGPCTCKLGDQRSKLQKRTRYPKMEYIQEKCRT